MMIVIAMFAVTSAVIVRSERPRPVKATSADPKIATRQEKVIHGVVWGMSYEQALEQAHDTNRPILVFFSGVNDPNCRLMEMETLARADIVP